MAYRCKTRFFCSPLKLYIPIGGQIEENSDGTLSFSGIPKTLRNTNAALKSWIDSEQTAWFNSEVKESFFCELSKTITKPEIEPEIETLGLVPPKVSSIDAVKGIVYFENESGLQIEVYKYTRHRKGGHVKGEKVWSDHLGKRYRVLYQLPYGTTGWTVPDIWIHQNEKRTHFKFGVRTLEGMRSDVSSITIITAIPFEQEQGIKILINQAN